VGARIETLFAHRGRAMPARNRTQAMFPQGSREIPNPQGTAPGIDLEWQAASASRRSRIFALPGVPAEMQQMWAGTVASRLVDEMGAGRRRIRQHVVKCFGVGESEMERMLGGLISRDHVPSVGITVSRATISLRITAESEDDEAWARSIAATREKIFRSVGDYVFGEGESYELQHAVAERLAARGDSLTVLELGFGGLAGGWLAELQQDGLLQAHLLAPSAPAMARLLDSAADNDPTLIAAACAKTGAAWGLLINDYPALEASDQPLPAHPLRLTVYDAATDRCEQMECALGGHPDIIKARIAKAGLDFLWRQLR
jgi:nicotinamide-nucleotide amidase